MVITRKRKVHYPKNWKQKNKKPLKYDEEITSPEDSCDEAEKNNVSANKTTFVSKPSQSFEKNDIPEPLSERCAKTDIQISLNPVASKIASTDQIPFNDIAAVKSVTCVVISAKNDFVIFGSKGGFLIKLTLNGAKLKSFHSYKRNSEAAQSQNRPRGAVLCVALSRDDRFLVSAFEDPLIHIYNADSLTHLNVLSGHRGKVYGLAFWGQSYQLFSCSVDRMVKVWNVEKVGFIDSLYGHESDIFSIDCLEKERALTVGNDGTVRQWKVFERSQLVFPSETPQSCLAMISDNLFISGSFDGLLRLWNISKKKPLFVLPNTHPLNPTDTMASKTTVEVSSIAAVPYSDVVATGSYDGFVRLFKVSIPENTLCFLRSFSTEGHINFLKFSLDGAFLVAGRGTEQRLGRWVVFKDKKLNGLRIFSL